MVRRLIAALALGALSTTALAAPSLFVANKRADTITKIDLTSGEAVAEIATCETPHELAVSPDGDLLAVACYGGEDIAFHETAKLELVHRVKLGEGARPHGIVWHAGGDIYATAEGRKSVFKVSHPGSAAAVTVVESATGQEGSHMIAVDAQGDYAWTADMGSATATRVDLAARKPVKSVALGREPEGIALTPDGQTLWVSARGSNEAFALDPQTMEVRARVESGRFPLRIAVRPQGDVAITSNLMDGSLSVIDLATNTITRTIAVSSREEAEARFQVTILWSGDGSKIYVAETGSNTVAEVDYATGRVLRRLAAGEGGDGLAIAP